MKFIHIGLGKTGTSTLQRYVFPKVAATIPNCEFNNRNALRLMRKRHFHSISNAEREALQNYFAKTTNVIISDESLVNWNPWGWSKAADINLELFGADSQILITLREDSSYLMSVYVQAVQEGLIKPPHEFFLDADEYQAMAEHIGPTSRRYYDLSMHDIETLVSLYRERFRHVTLARLDTLVELPFLDEISILSDVDRKQIRDATRNSPHANQSYNNLAMQFTFARERVLSVFGARSQWAAEDELLHRWREMNADPQDKALAKNVYFQNLSAIEKIKYLPGRVFRVIFSWRQFLQRFVSRLSSKRYKVPEGLLPTDIIARNNKFIEREVR